MATVRTPDLLVARLEEQVRELRAALEDAAEGICRVDTDGRVISVNRAFSRLTGYEAAEIVGRSWETTVSAADRPLVRADLQNAKEKVERDVHGARKDGTPFDMQLSVVPIVDLQSGRPGPKGHYFFIRDLTDRRRMENRLIFAGRMAAVGTLAAGVAHEINNPLAYIVANLDFVRQQMQDVCVARQPPAQPERRHGTLLDEAGEALAEARQGAERVRNIVRDLKVFARGDEEQSGPVDVRRVLDSAINIAWNEIRHRARLVKDYGDAPLVEGNEARLGQVFLNLLVNAAQAIPEGEAERQRDPRQHAHRRTRPRGGRGPRTPACGIPAEIRDAHLRPVLHDQAGGRGHRAGALDLPRHRERAGGEIAVDERAGQGHARSACRCRRSRARRRRRRGAGHAVDAGRAGRAAADRRRRADGRSARCGAIARARARRRRVGDGAARRWSGSRAGERFDVILCDLMMPEMTGMDLYAELGRLAPDQARADGLHHGRRLHAARARVPGAAFPTRASRSRSTSRI